RQWFGKSSSRTPPRGQVFSTSKHYPVHFRKRERSKRCKWRDQRAGGLGITCKAIRGHRLRPAGSSRTRSAGARHTSIIGVARKCYIGGRASVEECRARTAAEVQRSRRAGEGAVANRDPQKAARSRIPDIERVADLECTRP